METNNSEKKRRGKGEKRERKRRREGKRGGKDQVEEGSLSINSNLRIIGKSGKTNNRLK